MPDEYRVTIRLSPALYAQLETRGSHGLPLAAIVRDALADYLARQPEPPVSVESTATALAAMAATLTALQAQVDHLATRLDALAADWQSRAATRQPAAATPTPADTIPQAYDPEGAFARMQALQAEGYSLAQIAVQLTREGLRTRHGKAWHKSTVAYVLKTHGR